MSLNELRCAYITYYNDKFSFQRWLHLSSLDIAHYECFNCGNVQNYSKKCKLCRSNMLNMILCNGGYGHMNCSECLRININRWEPYMDDIFLASRDIQRVVRGYTVRKKLKFNHT